MTPAFSLKHLILVLWDAMVVQMVKNPPAMQEIQVHSLGWEDPLEKGMATHASILAGGSHGQRSLRGYNPWGHKESDMTQQLTLFHFGMLCSPRSPFPQ